MTNTWINAYGGVRNIELECSLLDFVELYKNRILTDYRVFEYAENEVELEFHDAIDKLNSRDRGKYEVEHHFMASLSGKRTMTEVIEIFAEKISLNVLQSTKSAQPNYMRLTDLTLKVFNSYL